MGTFKFAMSMLKKEAKKSFAFCLTIFFGVATSFVFFNIINNQYLVDHTQASSGTSFSSVSVPISTLVAFMIIIFCCFMLGFANNFYLSHKTSELAIMAMSGSSFMNTTVYLFYQTLAIALIALPFGLLAGVGGAFASNHFMYEYLSVHSSIFTIPFLAFRDTIVTFLMTLFILVFLDSGYVYTHDIQYMLSQEKSSTLKNSGGREIPSWIFILIFIFGFVLLLTTPYSASAYLFPCVVGVVGVAGLVCKTIPEWLSHFKKTTWINDKIRLVSSSNLAFSLKRSSTLISLYCLCTVFMIALLISEHANPREYITSIIGYAVIIILLSVSIMYKYTAEAESRKIFFFNLFKLGYVHSQLKKVIRHEVVAFFGLLLFVPMTYVLVLLFLFASHGAAHIGFCIGLVGVEVIPALIMALITNSMYKKSVFALIEEGTHYE